MSDICIRIEGRAGRITMQRPEALNALTAPMIPAISAALTKWAASDEVELVIFDAEGDKAFCAGGDIADLYAAGKAGDFGFGRRFWADEYRLNAQIADFPKPTVSFMQGFTMGGGVGLGCHCTHRIVGETSQIAMPECGIGLVPDVGGSMILAEAPGRLGEYLGLTAARMTASDAIHVGFADDFVPEATWDELKQHLIDTGDTAAISAQAAPAAEAPIAATQEEIGQFFDAPDLGSLLTRLDASDSDVAAAARKAIMRNSPLSMAAALVLIRRVREAPTIHRALTEEYRFTWRASEDGDFVEGIRAAIIDKDRSPQWKHSLTGVTVAQAEAMLAPLGSNDLSWEA